MIEQSYSFIFQDQSGSRAKNRFGCEIDWGIAKAYELYLKNIDFFVIFDCRCDIEVGEKGKGTIAFYQIKTQKNSEGSHIGIKRLCRIEKGKRHSIIGTLAALDIGADVEKLTLVWNAHYSTCESDSFSFLSLSTKEQKKVIDTIKNENGNKPDLSKFYFLYYPTLVENKDAFLLSMTNQFLATVLNEPPLAISQFITLVRGPVEKAADCEEAISNLQSAIDKKRNNQKQF